MGKMDELKHSSNFEQKIAIVHGKFNQIEADIRQKRARDAACLLGITEAQFVAAQCGAISSIRLSGNAADIFSQIPRLGPVMALTRNAHCVHERYGSYLNVQSQEPVGLVLGPDIDLRMFFSNWAHVWAVEEKGRSSFQFFDHAGQAVHKVFCTDESDMAEYVAIVGEYAAAQSWPEAIAYPIDHARTSLSAKESENADRPDIKSSDPRADMNEDPHEDSTAEPQAETQIEQQEESQTDGLVESQAAQEMNQFRQAWLAMTDTHDFYPLLKRFNMTRLAALDIAGDDLARRVPPEVVEDMLHSVAKSGQPIMCFVSNRGMIQIHTGAVKNIQRRGPWLNVLDDQFNLHLDTTKIASVWIVSKPTSDGWVTALEIFAESGEMMVQFFGARKPGIPELTVWRELMLGLSAESMRAMQ